MSLLFVGRGRSHRLGRLLPLCATLALLAGGLVACNRLSPSGMAARDDLALVPAEAETVVMLNLKQARGSRVWQKLIEARDKDPSSRKEYEAFIKKCQLDPLSDLDSFFLAVPAQAQQSREYALLLRGRYQPETIVACLRTSASERGETVSESEYGGIHIYTSGSTQGAQLALLGKRAIVVAGPTWMRKIIDLHTGKSAVSTSARDSADIKAMMGRTRVGDAAWWVGHVPTAMAERLRAWPQLGPAASLHSVSGSVDLSRGLAIHSDLDLGSDSDASTLTSNANTFLGGLRQDSKVQLIGMASYLDTIHVEARKSTFAIDIRLTDPQLDDLTNRLSGLARSLGSL